MNLKSMMLTVGLAASLALSLNAQTGDEWSTYYADGDFGNLNQNGGVSYQDPVSGLSVGPEACAPTSTINALTMLQNVDHVTLGQNYPVNANGFKAVDQLASAMGTRNNPNPPSPAYGTTYTGMINGVTSYLGAGGANPAPDVHIVGGQYAPNTAYGRAPSQTTINTYVPSGFIGGAVPGGGLYANVAPTAQWMAAELNDDAAVELGIQWGSYNGNNFTAAGGGHAVTLDYINFDPTTGFGTIKFLDSDTSASGAYQETGTIQLINGYLELTYATTVSGTPDPLDYLSQPIRGDALAGGGEQGRLIIDLAENVPDGGLTALMLGALLAGLGAFSHPLRRQGA